MTYDPLTTTYSSNPGLLSGSILYKSLELGVLWSFGVRMCGIYRSAFRRFYFLGHLPSDTFNGPIFKIFCIKIFRSSKTYTFLKKTPF